MANVVMEIKIDTSDPMAVVEVARQWADKAGQEKRDAFLSEFNAMCDARTVLSFHMERGSFVAELSPSALALFRKYGVNEGVM